MPLCDAFGNTIHGRALILGDGKSWDCVAFCCKTSCYFGACPGLLEGLIAGFDAVK